MGIKVMNPAGTVLIRPTEFEQNLSRRFRQDILKNGARRYVAHNGRIVAIVSTIVLGVNNGGIDQ